MQAGDVVGGRYRLVSPLGRGGMGTVWRGKHLTLDDEVAVKFHDARDDETARARFLREARAAAKLRGPNVVQVLDFGVEGDAPYIVMELLGGRSLRELLAKEGPLAPRRAWDILNPIATAIAKAHRLGIIHRDLKPANVQVVDDEEPWVVKVLDFGIAKLTGPLRDDSPDTETGSMVGTPHYMSPEQALGRRELDARSDQWSFAVIAFECLVGKRPFHGATLADLVLKICNDPIPVPSTLADVPPGFDTWFARGMSREPAERFDSMVEMRDQLERTLLGETDKTGSSDSRVAVPLTDAYAETVEARLEGTNRGVAKARRSSSPPLSRLLLVGGTLAVASWAAWTFLRSPDPPAEPATSSAPSVAAPIRINMADWGSSPVFSPDGRQVAYVESTAGGGEVTPGGAKIWVSEVGGRPRLLVSAQHVDTVAFHPDGTSLVWSGELGKAHTFVQPLDAREPTRRYKHMRRFAISPDGKRLLGANHGAEKLTEVDLKTETTREVSVPGQLHWLMGVDFSSDGQWVLLRVDPGQQHSNRIVLLDRDLERMRTLVDKGDLGTARFIGERASIVYTASDQLATGRRLFELAFDPRTMAAVGQPKQIAQFEQMGSTFDVHENRLVHTVVSTNISIESWSTNGRAAPQTLVDDGRINVHPRFSPDEKRIAFHSIHQGQSEVVVMNVDGSDRKVVASGGRNFVPRWSPEGDRLVFVSDRSGAIQLWTVDSSGAREPELLIDAPTISDAVNLSWAPSRSLFIQQPQNRNFTILDLETQSTHRLIAANEEEEGWAFAPAPHPNGKQVAVAWNRKEEREGIYLFDVAGGTAPTVLRPDYAHPLKWNADGTLLHAQKFEPSPTLLTIRAPSGDVAEIVNLPTPRTVTFDVTADGSTVVMAVNHSTSEVWVTPLPSLDASGGPEAP